jgi:hypothetical protein
MRAAIVITAILVAQPAEACHRFARWNYPWPQRCRVTPLSAYHAQTLPQAKAPEDDPSWYFEIVVPPDLDKLDHEDAVKKLKELR